MKKIIINGIPEKEVYDKVRHTKEIGELNQLFLEEDSENGEKLKRNIISKLRSYKNQDLKKNRYDEKSFISYEQIVEKLIISKLNCYYCKKCVLLLYSEKREKKQWSLDRIDNSICHSNENTVISCLQCNLQKRCRDKDKFKFTKQMRINKQI
jgi:hypothetical protein